MTKYTETSLEERMELLLNTPALSSMEKSILEALAGRMRDITYSAREVVVAKGEEADALFLIVKGRAQVSEQSEDKEIPLATLERGELFGEMAFFTEKRKRQATVTAITELRLLHLEEKSLNDLLNTNTELLNSIKELAETRTKLNLLKQFSPFTSLSPERIETLFSTIEKRSVGPGTTIMEQGEAAQECYLIVSGRMEVLASEKKLDIRKIATLYPGSIVGEAALLTDEPRSATVRALENCELLLIRRDTLLEIMREDTEVESQLLTVLRRRSRPRRADNIIVQEQKTRDGETLWILKNPELGTYVRLAKEGWFIWERLDGEHTLKDLTLDFMSEWKKLAPEKIAGIISELEKSGFLMGKNLRADVVAVTRQAKDSIWQRTLKSARRLVEFNVVWTGVDSFFSFLYSLVKYIFSRAVQIILAILSLGGLALFFTLGKSITPFYHDAAHSGPILIFLIPAIFASMVIHEIGHGITTKHFGREVRAAGIGWYWFSPIAFVDTTDMWTAGRWPRIAVSLAGPYANFILAGIASYIAWFSTSSVVSSALWQFALVSYISVLLNLHPLLEFDGYYILSDLLDRPNLRQRAIEWFGRFIRGDVDRRVELPRHRFDFSYSVSSIIYVIVIAFIFIISYRIVLESFFRSFLPDTIALVLPWIVISLIIISAVVTILSDMRILKQR